MKYFILLIAALLLFGGCSKNSPTLPDQLPSDFILNYQIDGGMSNYHVDMKVYRDTIELYVRNEGEKVNKKEKLGEGKFRNLYAFLKSTDLNNIQYKTVKETVQDRGGRSLKLSWDKNEIFLSDAQNNFITESSYEKWTKIVDEIEKFAGISQ